ncbi:methylated-DNA--[protein]-cysteine S-methyltransferase [Virgibacillus sp. 179-BFC.A HS]|uniref:Methylated-DNA--protein-cysteine methyltransferase n=1 Tax=Tigheibacillus jepli TaxID=3035914 RepID=A0ABU5CJ09_9BACI|nr:methylated-DNA--[protein]-cysteine S-methyltransferase [Virgibacillus sp. 179-BFC.A HS]MDY0406339.1 methylated-DNA--[protein]-cysteine S-methyltransferase [Virgibacillus sp. 179-BFC.A HS]
MAENVLHYDQFDTPVGKLLLVSDGENLLRIDYMTEDKLEEIEKWAHKFWENVQLQPTSDSVLAVGKRELTAYFKKGKKTFDIPFSFQGTDFQKLVWQALYDEVAYGQTKTYKDLAIAVGKPKAVRAVGGAVNKNPLSIIVPCHRIVGSNGKLVGYNGGLDRKKYLLDLELGTLFV